MTTQLVKQVRLFNEDRPNNVPKLFDECSGILFWDDINNQAYYEIYKEMREQFWTPDEVSMQQDFNQWSTNILTSEEKELFKTGIGVLAVLDSIATHFDKIASDYICDPAVKANMAFIAAMETIHNESYTYVLSSLSAKEESLEIFERPKKNEYVLKRNKLMMDKFKDFLEDRTPEKFAKALIAMSALEGVCFVNGFTPFYHLNRSGKMFGTGTMIQFIQRDEVKHQYFQTVLVRDILTQYPEIDKDEFTKFIYDFFNELVCLESAFCEDLYKDIPDIDVHEVIQYVRYRANLILDNLGLDKIYSAKKNPMPWITAFDPENINNLKRDYFEDKELNYVRGSEENNGWDDL